MSNLDYIKVKRFALMQLQGRWILPLAVQVITFIVSALFYVPVVAPLMGGGTIEDAVAAAEKPLPWASMIIFLLVVRVFFVAELQVYGAMTHGPGKVGFGTFIDGFADWRRAVLVTLCKGLFLYLWGLLFLFPAAIKFYSYYFAEYIVAEFPAVKSTRAVGISCRMMRGAKLQMFLLDVTLLPWVLLGTLIGSVGLMWAMPYVRMTHINAFHSLLKSAIEDGRVTVEELGARAAKQNPSGSDAGNGQEARDGGGEQGGANGEGQDGANGEAQNGSGGAPQDAANGGEQGVTNGGKLGIADSNTLDGANSEGQDRANGEGQGGTGEISGANIEVRSGSEDRG